MKEVFELDFNQVQLIGWEKKKGNLVIASIMEGIRRNCRFPCVPVHRIKTNTYHLSVIRKDACGFSDGGHHRAIALYIYGRLLRCVLVNNYSLILPCDEIDIRNIEIVDDSGQFREHKRRYPDFIDPSQFESARSAAQVN